MVKKIALFVSNALALAVSLKLLPEVIIYLSTPNSLEESQIFTVIIFLFSAPLLIMALILAIRSMRRRVYEKFSIWFNFIGALNIAIYHIFTVFQAIKMIVDYGEYITGASLFSMIATIAVEFLILTTIMVLATVPTFLKERY